VLAALVLVPALVLGPPTSASPPSHSPPVQVPGKRGRPPTLALSEAQALPQVELPLHCPSHAQAERAIGHYLGRPLAHDDPRTAMQIVETRGGYRLELDTPGGRHVLEGVDCGHLVELAASVAAVAIDPLAGLLPPPPSGLTERVEPEPLPGTDEPAIHIEAPRAVELPVPTLPPRPPESPTRAATPARDRGEPTRPRPRARLVQGRASASGSLGLGLFPGPSPGIELGLGLARRAPSRRVGLQVELSGGADFAGRFRAADLEVGGNLLAGHGALRACATPAWRRIELRPCARVGAGVLQASGIGVERPLRVRQPWVFAGAELGLAVTLHPNVALVLELGAVGNLLRPHVWTREPDADYVMPAISGRSRLGLEVRFP
jgi:hypothetical protein